MVIAVDSAKGDVGAHAFLLFLVFIEEGGLVLADFFFGSLLPVGFRNAHKCNYCRNCCLRKGVAVL